MSRKYVNNWFKRRQGATAVEAALCLPIVLLVLFACFQYGMFFYNTSNMSRVLDSASRDVLLMEDQSRAAILKHLRAEVPKTQKGRVGINVRIVKRFQGEFAFIVMNYKYDMNVPFADGLTMRSRYRNFLILSADVNADEDDD